MITIKSKNLIDKLDRIRSTDAYLFADLKNFDLINYTYSIVYTYDYNADGQNKTWLRTSNSSLTPSNIDLLFNQINNPITPRESFTDQMRLVITQAFLYQVATDGNYGVTLEDLEVFTGV